MQGLKAAPPGSAIRGWCPTAWRPMMAGDGLLVRVRPPLGRMDRAQTIALCEAALRYGNGLIDLTNRAAIQIRGVPEQDHRALVERLVALRLTDPDPAREVRSAIMLAPDWQAGDDTHAIACALADRLDELPDLPAKTGFAIDTGPAPVLSAAPADFRFERSADGTLLLRAEGRPLGTTVTINNAVDMLIRLTRWFVESGGMASGRMVRHKAALPFPAQLAPAAPSLFAATNGPFHGVPFGRIEADRLAALVEEEGVTGLRLTPWRGVIIEGSAQSPAYGLSHPLLTVDACPGAPACPQASVATRDLAVRLAPHVSGSLHISGCAKGCARPGPADVVLTGRDGRFDLARQARAGTPPLETGLTADQILARFGAS